ncbi:SGNH/GDSL hydrolase family protein [Arthrobacter sp. LAR12-1-1.1]|uniref:SGNH/GDSL hydrolase family protein n=1 Tax=Arthrobacter sp. LAR12-1-1.1 TaxID=3135215 RepID=UPI0034438DC6
MRLIRGAALIALVILLTTTSCADPVPSSSADGGPTPTNEPMVVLVIGDSIPFNSPDDCPGCTGFADSFAKALATEGKGEVTVRNRSRHDGAKTQDIAKQLGVDKNLIAELGTADVVLLSFGFNDQPPYASGGSPCQSVKESDDDAAFVSGLAGTTAECMDSKTQDLRALSTTILSRVRELSPNSSVGVLNSYNSWIGWEAASKYPDKVTAVAEKSAYALDAWNTALCNEAAAIKAACLDIYHAFNGVDGRSPAGVLLAADYTHPSQAGNDAITKVLLASETLKTGR